MSRSLGIVLATIFGALIGIARLSRNWLVAKLSLVYVETFRNIPLALQLLFWWSLLRAGAPAPRQAWQPLPGFFVSNRGVEFPVPQSQSGASLDVSRLCRRALPAPSAVSRWGERRQAATGAQFPSSRVGAGLVVGLPLLVFVAAGAPMALDWPALKGLQLCRRRRASRRNSPRCCSG